MEKTTPITSQVGWLIQTSRYGLRPVCEVKLTKCFACFFFAFCTISLTQLTDSRVVEFVVDSAPVEQKHRLCPGQLRGRKLSNVTAIISGTIQSHCKIQTFYKLPQPQK